MGWELVFLVNGNVAVLCTTSNTLHPIIYDNLQIFQCYYGYMDKKGKDDPRTFDKNEYDRWCNKNLDDDLNPKQSVKKLIDNKTGETYFDDLPEHSKKYLRKNYSYYK